MKQFIFFDRFVISLIVGLIPGSVCLIGGCSFSGAFLIAFLFTYFIISG